MRTYRVGGSVRDELLGRRIADRDWVVVGATPETMVASGFRPVGRDFPVFLHPDTQEEYALARTERKAGIGYRGFAFFASPEVTLEDDLKRRDLTINAMARADDGTLIDPHGGRRDLEQGVLRHVSEAFAEDPLRVLRVARFAARFGFTVAPPTEKLMRAIVASGELQTLAPERVWRELATGLSEATPSRMFAVLRDCGALAVLLPEIDALFGVPQPPKYHPEIDTGVHVMQAIDFAAARGLATRVRFAVLAHDLGKAASPSAKLPSHHGHEQSSVRRVETLSKRLRVPLESAELARLVARWHGIVHRGHELTAGKWLELLQAADAFRRPQRLTELLQACECDALSRPGAASVYQPVVLAQQAFEVATSVDVGAVATEIIARAAKREAKAAPDAIGKAVRAARVSALRAWRDTRPTVNEAGN
ncbi:MAG TPA: multifunctional CCA addition/repair protein [Casimicrobiaceae bacterium]|nr:multifunctional CCA addition/repair protein [Casimicrobiaceae bacterium]